MLNAEIPMPAPSASMPMAQTQKYYENQKKNLTSYDYREEIPQKWRSFYLPLECTFPSLQT
jgi:hypothetical protein